MFAIELMMPELSARTFLQVALATGTATCFGRIFFGIHPASAIREDLLNARAPAPLSALLLFAFLGSLIGIAATVFIHGLSLAEDVFERIKNPYGRSTVGMLVLGVALYAFYVFAGHYYVEGVGYSTIQAILTGELALPALLLLLFAAKLCATSISLGAGASGGTFFAVTVHGRGDRWRVRRFYQCCPSYRRDQRHGLPSSAWPRWWLAEPERP